MDIHCRQIELSDLELLLKTPEGVFDDALVSASARAFLSTESNILVGAIDTARNVIIGFASAMIYVHPDKPIPEMWINEVGVHEDYRRQGIGKMIMDETLEIGRSKNCKVAWLATDHDNIAARALYKSSGGKPPEDQIHIDFDL